MDKKDDKSNAFSESYKRMVDHLLNSQPKSTELFTLLHNPQDTPRYDTGQLRNSWAVGDNAIDETVSRIDVVSSNFVPQGVMYLVPRPRPFASHPLGDEWNQRIGDRFRREIDSILLHGFSQPTARPDVIPVRWERRQNETLIAWGNRLAESGLIDNYAIRFEYQKAIWLGLFNSAQGLVKWVLEHRQGAD